MRVNVSIRFWLPGIGSDAEEQEQLVEGGRLVLLNFVIGTMITN